ncbi:MAG TPA: abortive infection family protein [Micromonosporaceae bacterium]|nr:abortive infection family protein [Micromonosporaceae bacterium]
MTTITRPPGLDETSWDAIEERHRRLERAMADGDWSLVVGAAKELVETVAGVVLHSNGEVISSAETMPMLLARTHAVLERDPRHLAADPAARTIIQSVKAMVTQLAELRNRHGTGHGRPVPTVPAPELAELCADTAIVWVRWALRRLPHLLTGQPAVLARDLDGAGIFRGGELADRLREVNLLGLGGPDQHLLGVAVARRAMGITSKTFTVAQDGVEACANDRSLNTWPAEYRRGLIEGLFIDRGGFVDVDTWAVRCAARVIAPHPDPAAALRDLSMMIGQATWSARFAANAAEREQVAREMPGLAAALPAGEAQEQWLAVGRQLTGPAGYNVLDLLPPYGAVHGRAD